MTNNLPKRIALWGELFSLKEVKGNFGVYIGEDTGLKLHLSEARIKEYEATDQLQRSWEV